jgi:hypothetical protein
MTRIKIDEMHKLLDEAASYLIPLFNIDGDLNFNVTKDTSDEGECIRVDFIIGNEVVDSDWYWPKGMENSVVGGTISDVLYRISNPNLGEDLGYLVLSDKGKEKRISEIRSLRTIVKHIGGVAFFEYKGTETNSVIKPNLKDVIEDCPDSRFFNSNLKDLAEHLYFKHGKQILSELTILPFYEAVGRIRMYTGTNLISREKMSFKNQEVNLN